MTDPTQLIPEVESDFTIAAAMAANGTLWSSHATVWQSQLWSSRIELVGTDAPPGGSSPGNALFLAQAVNMSYYSILSSIREDRVYGLSPGGLTNGALDDCVCLLL